jgi:hypothetical protein
MPEQNVTRFYLATQNADGTVSLCDIYEITTGADEAWQIVREWKTDAELYLIDRGYSDGNGEPFFPFRHTFRRDAFAPIPRAMR